MASRTHNQTIPGYRIQPMLPLHVPIFDGLVTSAEFVKVAGGVHVGIVVRLGAIGARYDITISIAQALAADIIERA